MTDLIRWNSSFFRGLAEKILGKAKAVRCSLETREQDLKPASSGAVAKSVNKKSRMKKSGVKKRRAKPKRND